MNGSTLRDNTPPPLVDMHTRVSTTRSDDKPLSYLDDIPTYRCRPGFNLARFRCIGSAR